MGTPRFTPEFKEEAVRQITERGYSVAEVSGRLGFEAGLERNYISMLELGQRHPSLATIFKPSLPLNVTPSYIVALMETTISSESADLTTDPETERAISKPKSLS